MCFPQGLDRKVFNVLLVKNTVGLKAGLSEGYFLVLKRKFHSVFHSQYSSPCRWPEQQNGQKMRPTQTAQSSVHALLCGGSD